MLLYPLLVNSLLPLVSAAQNMRLPLNPGVMSSIWVEKKVLYPVPVSSVRVEEYVVYPLLLSTLCPQVKTLSVTSPPLPQGESYQDPSELSELPLLVRRDCSGSDAAAAVVVEDKPCASIGPTLVLVNSTRMLPSLLSSTLGLPWLSREVRSGLCRLQTPIPLLCVLLPKYPKQGVIFGEVTTKSADLLTKKK